MAPEVLTNLRTNVPIGTSRGPDMAHSVPSNEMSKIGAEATRVPMRSGVAVGLGFHVEVGTVGGVAVGLGCRVDAGTVGGVAQDARSVKTRVDSTILIEGCEVVIDLSI